MLVKEGWYLVIFVLANGFIFILFQIWSWSGLVPTLFMLVGNIMVWLPAGLFLTFSAYQQDIFHFLSGTPFFLIKIKRNDSTKSAPAAAVQILRSVPVLILPGICHKPSPPGNFIQNWTPKNYSVRGMIVFHLHDSKSRDSILPLFSFWLLTCPEPHLKLLQILTFMFITFAFNFLPNIILYLEFIIFGCYC